MFEALDELVADEAEAAIDVNRLCVVHLVRVFVRFGCVADCVDCDGAGCG